MKLKKAHRGPNGNMALRSDKSAVSPVVSYIFAFALSAVILTMSFSSLSTVQDLAHMQAAEDEMADVANRVAAGINIAVEVYRSNPNATYSRTISIPEQIRGYPYYISASSGAVYANATNGRVQESSTTYNADEEGVEISGTAYSGAGHVTVTLLGAQSKIELTV